MAQIAESARGTVCLAPTPTGWPGKMVRYGVCVPALRIGGPLVRVTVDPLGIRFVERVPNVGGMTANLVELAIKRIRSHGFRRGPGNPAVRRGDGRLLQVAHPVNLDGHAMSIARGPPGGGVAVPLAGANASLW